MAAAQKIKLIIGPYMAHNQRHRHPNRDADHNQAALDKREQHQRLGPLISFGIRQPGRPRTGTDAPRVVEPVYRLHDSGSRRSCDCCGSPRG